MSNETTITPQQRRHDQVQTFIAALGALNAGGRARLRRNAGRTLAEARDVYRVFFQALPNDIHERQEDDYFLVATLFPLVPHTSHVGTLGSSLHRVRQIRNGTNAGPPNSLDRRFQALLDSDREQLSFRLRQVVRLIAADRADVPLDWVCLLQDILNWTHPSHFVQMRWARDYFVGPSTQAHKADAKGDLS